MFSFLSNVIDSRATFSAVCLCLLLNKTFFTKDEMIKIKKLADLILPPNSIGNIEKAEVPEFIEFIVKDVPSFQKKIRDGLNWIDDHSKKSFNKSFYMG